MDFDEDDLRIIANVKSALSASPAWQEKGFVHIRVDEYVALDVAAKQAPTESGLYALCLSEGLRYDEADSRIVYLGSAKNLRSRLAQHNRKPHNHLLDLLRQEHHENICVAWWAIPHLNRKFLYGIEGEALRVFERRLGSLPICNLDVPEFFEGQEYCTGLVRVSPCVLAKPLTLSELAERLDRVLTRKEFEPVGGGVIRLAGDSIDAPRTHFSMAAFLTREQAEAETGLQDQYKEEGDCARDEAHAEKMQLYELSLIHDVNIAAWSVHEMLEIIGLCRNLRPKSTKAKTMKPFEAPFRKVPVPHTWGEVALVQARIVGGSWQPGRQVWVKVVHGKELLGEAKLNRGWYVGEDKSDLPQRKTKRPKCRKHDRENEPTEFVEETEEIEEIYGLEISMSRTSETLTEEQVRDELQEEQAALWQAVEDLFQQALAL